MVSPAGAGAEVRTLQADSDLRNRTVEVCLPGPEEAAPHLRFPEDLGLPEGRGHFEIRADRVHRQGKDSTVIVPWRRPVLPLQGQTDRPLALRKADPATAACAVTIPALGAVQAPDLFPVAAIDALRRLRGAAIQGVAQAVLNARLTAAVPAAVQVPGLRLAAAGEPVSLTGSEAPAVVQVPRLHPAAVVPDEEETVLTARLTAAVPAVVPDEEETVLTAHLTAAVPAVVQDEDQASLTAHLTAAVPAVVQDEDQAVLTARLIPAVPAVVQDEDQAALTAHLTAAVPAVGEVDAGIGVI